MEAILQFLKDCKTFYIATMDGDQPRVRPFGAVCSIGGKLYICANNKKLVAQQIRANPKIEISATSEDRRWLRLTAEAIVDDRREAREAMLDALPNLRNMYSADDGLYEVYYLRNATGVINSFGGENEVHTF